LDPFTGEASMILVQIAMGISLAACAGLRAFLPLLVAGLAGRFDWIPLGGRFEWLETTPALIVFGVAVLVEILGDKVPVVDHTLDTLQTFVKPVAGTLLAASVLTELSPLQATVLGLVTGGVVAETVHLSKANVRVASTLASAGIANPILSIGEDALTLAGSVLAIAIPLVTAVAALAGVALVWWTARRLSRREENAP
jgi:hypothetical protein